MIKQSEGEAYIIAVGIVIREKSPQEVRAISGGLAQALAETFATQGTSASINVQMLTPAEAAKIVQERRSV